VAPETAGDPMSDQKWVRRSLRTLSARLREAGHAVSPPTVGRLLKTLDDALHVNAKKIEARASHPDRDAPCGHIADQRQAFTDAGLPIISVDTKKKELIGAFKDAGRAWSQEAEAVNVHDVPSDARGRAVPYGVYDVTHNRGTVYVGSSGDTARFAVDALARWWETAGRATYPTAAHLLILADGGGRHGYRSHLWTQHLQERLCDGLGLTVSTATVCHYPRSCSMWNQIEHRLFGPISLNWAAQPLRTWDTLMAFIRSTTTTTGLTVQAERLERIYPTGLRVSPEEMSTLNLTAHAVCPSWNYTIQPRLGAHVSRPRPSQTGKLLFNEPIAFVFRRLLSRTVCLVTLGTSLEPNRQARVTLSEAIVIRSSAAATRDGTGPVGGGGAPDNADRKRQGRETSWTSGYEGQRGGGERCLS